MLHFQDRSAAGHSQASDGPDSSSRVGRPNTPSFALIGSAFRHVLPRGIERRVPRSAVLSQGKWTCRSAPKTFSIDWLIFRSRNFVQFFDTFLLSHLHFHNISWRNCLFRVVSVGKPAGRWGDSRSCDSPVRLMENMFSWIAKNEKVRWAFFPHGAFIPSGFRRRSTELARIQRFYPLDWLHFMDGRSAGPWHLESDQAAAAVGPENDHQIPSRFLPQHAGFPGSGESRELTRRFLPTTERERRLWPIFQFFQKFSKKFSKIFQNFPKIFCIIS